MWQNKKVYEDNHKKRNERLQQLNEIIAKQETFQVNRKSSIEEEIQELRLQKTSAASKSAYHR